MHAQLRRLVPSVAGALLAASLVGGVAMADPGTKLVDASMTGIPTGGLALQGVAGGGIPWVLERGDARLFADGRLEVSVRHLVLAAGALKGTNPIAQGRAIVTCNGGATVLMSDLVPYSADGNAMVETTLQLPSPCLAPVVFFAGQTGNGPRWFAVTGG